MSLVGIGDSGLKETGLIQGLLLDQESGEKQACLDAVADETKKRGGSGAIRRGSSLDHRDPK